ncbi:MAG: hypothetical protein HQK88_10360 [Nitrospirae bacterium]|nr:hypothetical protein [Nitrospirota bacterium]MBF0534948.1 hypothetical protein [Nitrospirota bacterium]MBF0617201.1 hypothetical protein [Nitrospirota bacterium]
MWIITEHFELLNLDHVVRIKRVKGEDTCKIVSETVKGDDVFIRFAHSPDGYKECANCNKSGKETGMIKIIESLNALDISSKSTYELHFRTG